jgi:hypothetical protein
MFQWAARMIPDTLFCKYSFYGALPAYCLKVARICTLGGRSLSPSTLLGELLVFRLAKVVDGGRITDFGGVVFLRENHPDFFPLEQQYDLP